MSCSKCKSSSEIIISHNSYLGTIDSEVAVDIRFDVDYNCIDYIIGTGDESHIADASVAISYCPFCGMKLQRSGFITDDGKMKS